MEYRTAERCGEDFFLEKKSKFIGNIAPVRTPDETMAFINKIRAEHPQARHHVYAYILRWDNTVRYSDAGEPSGTGGQPVLGVLQKQRLSDVCVVVTRYFGGVLLGAGGLTRAYAKAAGLAVEAGGMCVMRLCEQYKIECGYGQYDLLCSMLAHRPCAVDDAEFAQTVSFTVSAIREEMPGILASIEECTGGRAKTVKIEEKFIKFPK